MICACLLGGARLVAQDAPYFEVLTLPPRYVGTCVSLDTAGSVVARGAHLVITSVAPYRRREIGIRNNVEGDAISLMDMTYLSTGSLSSDGDYVVAMIDSANRVRGFRQHTTIQMPDSGVRGLDTTGLRAMKARTIQRSPAETLDASARRKVVRLVSWLRKRCPN